MNMSVVIVTLFVNSLLTITEHNKNMIVPRFLS